MSKVTRTRFDGTFGNEAIDLGNDTLATALAGAGLDAAKLDTLDGTADGRVSGQRAIDALYDEVDRLDTHTAALSSKQERAVWDALRGAAIAPAPISAEQGQALAAAARRLVAEDTPAPGKSSQWSLDGTATCENPALGSRSYAGPKVWKCNVFVGEAFHKADLPFPMNGENHYVAAGKLAAQSRFFRPVASIEDVRPGDVIAVHRKAESGHVEIVTGVQRGTDGRITSISSAGAHLDGSRESNWTAALLVDASRTTVQLGDETYQILRPMTPAAGR
jgi:hypothetical protein